MELIDDADWPVVSKRYGLPDRSALRDRPQRPVSLSKAASRSGSSARRGSIEVCVCPLQSIPMLTDNAPVPESRA